MYARTPVSLIGAPPLLPLTSQAKREKLFMRLFNIASRSIDGVYKSLTEVDGAPLGGTAILGLEDQTDPFNHGVLFTVMPPGKRYREMGQLSGGERTLAALALMFALHEFHRSPFFVMDEMIAS